MNQLSEAPGYLSQVTPTLQKSSPHMFELKKLTINLDKEEKKPAIDREKLLAEMIEQARLHDLYMEKTERFKGKPGVYITIFSFLEIENATLSQALNKEFYKTIAPLAMVGRQCLTVTQDSQHKTLFSDPRHVLSEQAISFIKVISDDEILVCANAIDTRIYRHNSKDPKRPWKKVFEPIATLKEVSGQRITCAAVSNDYFVISSDQYWISMFDKASYKCIDKTEIKAYVVNTMCLINADRLICGHEGSIITLWDTYRDELNDEQLQKLKERLKVEFSPSRELIAKWQEQRRTLEDVLDYAKKAMDTLVPVDDAENQLKFVYDEKE